MWETDVLLITRMTLCLRSQPRSSGKPASGVSGVDRVATYRRTRRDILHIWLRIAHDNEPAADRFIDRLTYHLRIHQADLRGI